MEAELLHSHCSHSDYSFLCCTNITESTNSCASPYRVCGFGDLQQLLFGSPLSILRLSQILFEMICLLQPGINKHINILWMRSILM